MSSLMIRNLPGTRDLDRRAMSEIAGGNNVPGVPSVAGMAGIANISVSVNQTMSQMQYVNVAALNNVGVIGAGFVPLHLNVSPSLWGANYANV